MKTKRGEFNFVVKERPDGTVWIAAEPSGGEEVFKGLMGFDLPFGTTLERAKEIAADMRQRGTAHGTTGGDSVGLGCGKADTRRE